MKTDEEILLEKIKELENIAFKNGWETGKHIFHYLDETQMMQYDNIKEELVILKTRQKATEEIQKKVFEEIDKEAKKQYNKFAKETGLKLQPNGWEDWKIDREELKQSLQNIFNSNSQSKAREIVSSKTASVDNGDSSKPRLDSQEGESPDAHPERVKCIYCGNPIHLSKFAGITKKGYVCSNSVCLMKLAQEIEESPDAQEVEK